MRRHLLKLLSLWILPLLVARALVPAGFMLSVDSGQLQLMFCAAGVIQPMAGHHPGMDHQGMHHEGMHHHGGGSAQDHAPCPFSLAASATPPTVAYLADTDAAPSDERFEFISSLTFRVGPVRTDRIRGPPSLA